jgi:signal peptidase I
MIKRSNDMFLYATAGGSMYPLIHWTDHLLVRKTPAEHLRIGDIIVFQVDSGKPICHRITKIEYQNNVLQIYTRGDRNVHEEGPLSAECITGKVIAVGKKNRIHEMSELESTSWAGRVNLFLLCTVFFLKNRLKRVVMSLKNPSPQ